MATPAKTADGAGTKTEEDSGYKTSAEGSDWAAGVEHQWSPVDLTSNSNIRTGHYYDLIQINIQKQET